MGSAVRAVTLRHPWSFAIAHLGKDIENRTWKPPKQMIGQRIAIHGGALPKGHALEDCAGQARFIAREILTPAYLKSLPAAKKSFLSNLMPLKVHHFITSGIVATAVLERVVTESDSPWFFGPYGWVLSDVITLTEPVHCKGAQGLWRLPEDVRQKMTL